MSFVAKYAILILACCLVLPSAFAQTIVVPNTNRSNPDRVYLGIQMEDVTSSNMAKYKLNSERGVIVRSVQKGSPAAEASLQEEDVILEFAGFPVWSSKQMARLVEDTPAGRKVELAISRGGKKINLTAQLRIREGERASNRDDVLPRDRDQIERFFQYFGPDGRSFQFRTPESPQVRPFEPSSEKPRLGVTLQALTDQSADFFGVPGKKGTLVVSAASGSPAEGKLKYGDVIISADGKSINDPDDLVQFVRNKAEGDVVLKVIRDKKEISVTVTLPREEGRGFKL